MACYLISYDLINKRNYEGLYEAIKSYGTWAKVHESVWAVVTEKSAADVRDHLKTFMDGDDRIFVIRSGGAAAWRGVLCSSEWLKKNL